MRRPIGPSNEKKMTAQMMRDLEMMREGLEDGFGKRLRLKKPITVQMKCLENLKEERQPRRPRKPTSRRDQGPRGN